MTRTNAFGDELTGPQEQLAAAYDLLERVLRDHSDELAPFEQRNALKALAALWHVMDGLDLDPAHVYDLGA